jgi:hypothetical protein
MKGAKMGVPRPISLPRRRGHGSKRTLCPRRGSIYARTAIGQSS